MKIPALTARSVQNASRWSRLLVTIGTLVFGAAVLQAQTAPSITASPVNADVPLPTLTSATFTVAVSGDPVPTIQWYRNIAGAGWLPLLSTEIGYSGVTSNVLTVSGVTTAMNGYQFRAIATNSTTPFTATSGTATLNVRQAPAFTSVATASFTAGIAGTTYQLTATGLPAPAFGVISGSLPAGLVLDSTTGIISGTPLVSTGSPFQLVIRALNTTGFADQNFTLLVSAVPVFTTQPINATASLGGTASFTVVAAGEPAPTLRWQRQLAGSSIYSDLTNDGTFSGVTTATLTITTATSGMNGDSFRAVATNTAGVTEGLAATLTITNSTTISTVAGKATESGSLDGVGAAARFNGPTGIAVDLAGSIYVADASNHVIRKISTGGNVVTIAGLAGATGKTDGHVSVARFSGPSGVAVSATGMIYVADTYNHTIRAISPDGTVTTLAGTGAPGAADTGVGVAAQFFSPSGLAMAPDGTIYVADTFNHTIRRVQLTGVVTTVAGKAGTQGSVNGTGTAAQFTYPYSVAVDSGGNIYVADSVNHAIRKIDTTGLVTTLAGNVGIPGSVDGTGTAALFSQPSGVAVDSTGNVYVADTANNTIRRITTTAPVGVVTTLAGVASLAGADDGVIAAARFRQPFGIAIDSTGNLYIADTRNHTIRRTGYSAAPSITTHPVAGVAAVGGSASFTVVATGVPTPTYFTWLRQPAGVTGFSPIVADSMFSGVNTATLTITGMTAAMNGDQYQVVVSNLIGANATSLPAALTVGTPPVFTSVAQAEFQATVAGTFTVAATATPAPVLSVTGLPTWAFFDPATGILSGTAPDTTGAPFTLTFRASNGIVTNQTFTLAVRPAIVAPTITVPPANATIDQGGFVSFGVTVGGTAPFTYQWNKDGVAIAGATGANLTLTSVQPASAGSYTVRVTNPSGSVTSSAALLSVNTAPVIVQQPRSQTVLVGGATSFTVSASGSASFNYQWRKFGVPLVGANGATLALPSVTTADAGNYDVQVSNGLGTVTSALAQLVVASSPVAPTVNAQPANRTVLVGSSVRLEVGASGAPSPSYQWRKDGAAIAGATGSTLVLTSAQTSDSGAYDVVIINSAGSIVSGRATLRILTRSSAGTYFGSFFGGLGNFALYVRGDNTGVFLGFLPGVSAPVLSLNLDVSDAGAFSFNQAAVASTSTVSPLAGEPARESALASLTLSGAIGADGSVVGSVVGGVNASFTASRASDTGGTQNVNGFYQAGAANSGTVSYTIAGPNGQAFALVQSGSISDGGLGTVGSSGVVTVNTNRSVISSVISTGTGTITGNVLGAISANLSGGSESAIALQRLVNISSRARVGTGDSIAIAGFVISGVESKPVLIRAVGPTLATFNVTGVLASPRLELFRGTTSLAVNTGIAANRVEIDAAARQAGAFALGTSGADAAIVTTLPPGNYTAQVTSTTGTAGVAMVEVYDLSTAAPGQKLMNISTRAAAGTADATLIAGFVVPPGATKRVLVRGVGPGLAAFGVSGVLAQPTLQLLRGTALVAQNTNWSTSADRDAIANSSAQVGAFGLSAGDSALIATLTPGDYSAIVTGAGTAVGVAMIEVYELP